ncbi:MAG TPA: hypothetical protein VKE93_04295 [Candidatus Angelobacter sp.]|nr:hypothetical protein [Candidatus Angelobacter sp.]
MFQQDVPEKTNRWAMPFLALAITAACLMYRILVLKRLEQTALLFAGIPALLAVIVACTPKAKTLIGGTLRATTFFLLLSGPLLGEGFICIVMAAPIFYAVALGIAGIITVIRTSGKNRNQNILPCLALIAILPMTLEGSRPALSLNREEAVTARRVVHATNEEVEGALSKSQRTNLSLPFFFKSFPHPTEAHGQGLRLGDLRAVHFAGGEGHPGDVVLRVVESAPGHVRFEAVSDKSKIAHWLAWEYADVRWQRVDATHTQVEWTLGYRRLLDPAWYFRPWERYAVRVSADYLIRANATPEGRE